MCEREGRVQENQRATGQANDAVGSECSTVALALVEVPCDSDEDEDELVTLIEQAAASSKGTVSFSSAESFTAWVLESRKKMDQQEDVQSD